MKMIGRILGSVLIALMLLLIMGTQYYRRVVIGAELQGQSASILFSDFESPDCQWMVAVCLSLYFVGFAILRRRMRSKTIVEQCLTPRRNSVLGFSAQELCLFVFVGVASLTYISQSPASASKPEFLVLIAGLMLGQCVSALRLWWRKQGRNGSVQQLLLPAFIFVLTMGAVFHPDMGKIFQYRDKLRWMGPWDNPNTFGLLMGLGAIVAAGQSLKRFASINETSVVRESQLVAKSSHFSTLLYLIATLIMGFGLIKSYSRGAWAATFCGLAYLVYAFSRTLGFGVTSMKSSPERCYSKLWHMQKKWRRSLPSLVLIILSLLVIAFWSFRHTEQVVIRRTFSLGNMNDFSWRNRVVATEGALQMMTDRPWFGFGWIKPESVYNEYYRPAKLVEGMAIVLNDYFVLGMTLGLPALICFLIYVYSRFHSGHTSLFRSQIQLSSNVLDMAVCRAGLIVLLVGFVPERGLFILATAIPFWILLELGTDE